MRITIKKIAEMSGVSRGTVDRALNGRPGVNPEVAKRIKEIARKYGYKPNLVAKALVTYHRPCNIGVIVNSEGNPFFDEVLAGIHDAAAQISDFGVKVIVRTTAGYIVERQLEIIDKLVSTGINMLVITPIDDPAIREKLNNVIVGGINVVTLNNDIQGVKRLFYIGCDYWKSGRTACGLLGMITRGEANVGIVTGSNKILGHKQRILGFMELQKEEFPGLRVVETIQNEDNDELSYDRVKKMLTTYKDINALYFTAGGTSGGIKAVCDLGLGKKIDIVTFDLTNAVKEYLEKGIVSATVCQQPYKQGFDAIKLAFDFLFKGQSLDKDVINTQIEIKLKYNL